MSDQDKLLNQLLNEAPFAPTSEGLRDDILVAAMLDTTATHPSLLFPCPNWLEFLRNSRGL